MTCLCSDYFYNISQASSNSSWGQVDWDVPFTTSPWLNRVFFVSTRYELATHLKTVMKDTKGLMMASIVLPWGWILGGIWNIAFFLLSTLLKQVPLKTNKQWNPTHIPPYWYSSHSTELTNEIRKFMKLFEWGCLEPIWSQNLFQIVSDKYSSTTCQFINMTPLPI